MPRLPYPNDSDADGESSDMEGGSDGDEFPDIPSTVGEPGSADYVEFTTAELKVMKRYIVQFRDGNAKTRAALLTDICAEVYPLQPTSQTKLQWVQRGRVSTSSLSSLLLIISS